MADVPFLGMFNFRSRYSKLWTVYGAILHYVEAHYWVPPRTFCHDLCALPDAEISQAIQPVTMALGMTGTILDWDKFVRKTPSPVGFKARLRLATEIAAEASRPRQAAIPRKA